MTEHDEVESNLRVGLTGTVFGSGTNIQAARDVTLNQLAPQSRESITDSLPRDLRKLVGRIAELQYIEDLSILRQEVNIFAIDGMPGVGKTALAIKTAHKLASEFPDGRFFVELRTHTPNQTPTDPSDVLATLLIGLGLDPRNIPESIEARRNLWRDRVASKRILLVLDDARDQAQIEPILPGGKYCLTLITSRCRLVALDGAVPLSLDTLNPESAIKLFYTLARPNPIESDKAYVARIVQLCGYLPLAVVLVAGRMAHRTTWTFDQACRELEARQNRLNGLSGGERSVRAAFAVSYHNLPFERQQFFRRLSLYFGTDVDAYAAAALADVTYDTACNELDTLYLNHLVEENTSGRYRVHDLLREYVQDLNDHEPSIDRSGAISRLLEYYQYAGTVADQYLACVTRPRHAPRIYYATIPRISSHADALAWMRTERVNLAACLEYAVFNHDLMKIVCFAMAFPGLLRLDGTWQQAIKVYSEAAAAANRLGDHLTEANALNELGDIKTLTTEYSEACSLQLRALELYRLINSSLGEANALKDLGRVRLASGDYGEAQTLLQAALEICLEIDDQLGEANALKHLGRVRCAIADYAGAEALFGQALTIYSEIDDRLGQAEVLNCMGALGVESMQPQKALVAYISALQIARQIQSCFEAASALEGCARSRILQDVDLQLAKTELSEAVELYERLGAAEIQSAGKCLSALYGTQ